MKRISLVAWLSLSIAACGGSVRQDDPPATDSGGAAGVANVGAGGAGAMAGAGASAGAHSIISADVGGGPGARVCDADIVSSTGSCSGDSVLACVPSRTSATSVLGHCEGGVPTCPTGTVPFSTVARTTDECAPWPMWTDAECPTCCGFDHNWYSPSCAPIGSGGNGGSSSGATGAGGAAGAAGSTGTAGSSAAGASGGASATPLYDCFEDVVQPTDPASFASLFYQHDAMPACSSSACEISLGISANCQLSLTVDDIAHSAIAQTNDCAALARWATSKLIADAFADSNACQPPATGNPPEHTEIELTSGPGPRKKTGDCMEEPFFSHRACMNAVRARYFPGI